MADDASGPAIGLVLVTHGQLAAALRAALEHVVGPLEGVATVCIDADDDMETRRRDILAGVRAVDAGQGVIVLTDMFGGTPSNLAISIMDKASVEVIAGVNLPMLVKLAGLRDSASLNDAAAAAEQAGRKYIRIASKLMEGEV
ncbi:MAG: PTS fructose transporter subunit IIA [Alphaproteobacteria bacterium]|nr:PTS fructose transporter subunit IIA [Alphaproteobacteria bacterium]MEC7592077.1 PTS fructose transporter subunit IIA [Pseudomonadota bacterium]MEC7675109.1 PTS fructose transporter subunit IIA [Pseudomonadota bacterium]MEC8083437.1 PTS fructose transporter subunit IIA [Pseudomonadota bacterium]MEC8117819.1 PTS fructose transporter subunit IIA [Pseudomonadota bacterium]